MINPARLAGAVLGAALLAVGAAAPAAPTTPSAKTTNAATKAAAAGVLQRVLGAPAAIHFDFQPLPACEGECMSVKARGGAVTVAGNTPVAQAYGAAAYLRQIGALDTSWEGGRVSVPARLPEASLASDSPFALRAYLNVCAFGYSTAWWDWARWEREIDWMALHGVNLPTAMEGQEYVWRALWKEFGLKDADLEAYFAGPAFLPWQRMGNIGAHRGPLPAEWIDSRRILQSRILGRMRELGMQPVTPGFGGYVPRALAALYPQARIHRMKPWNDGFEGMDWLDPRDPLFARIAKRFLELYRETYGATRYHLADAFNEITPPVTPATKMTDLAEYGQILYGSIRSADPTGVWVMQSWLFGHDKAFWSKEAAAAFFSKVPDEGVLIEDIGNDRYALWKDLDAFSNKPWLFGFIHNYGAADAVYGDFARYRSMVEQVLADPAHGRLAGFGVFPEGIDNNSVVYDYLFDLPWRGRGGDWNNWIPGYLASRYGQVTPGVRAGWDLLRESVYSDAYWKTRWWRRSAGTYLLHKRPSVALAEFEGHPGDARKLRAALDLLLADAGKYRNEALYRYDLLELGRHYLSMQADERLVAALQAYKRGDLAAGDAAFAEASAIVRGLDALVGSQPNRSLAASLDSARAVATGAMAAERYADNAKAIVTVWGGARLHDYASKSWQGLLADFYLPRWSQYLAEVRAAAQSGQPLDDAAAQQRLRAWEEQWVAAPAVYKRSELADPVNALRELLAKSAQKP
jgi:alpha-N-acetylglucosaminidase